MYMLKAEVVAEAVAGEVILSSIFRWSVFAQNLIDVKFTEPCTNWRSSKTRKRCRWLLSSGALCSCSVTTNDFLPYLLTYLLTYLPTYLPTYLLQSL